MPQMSKVELYAAIRRDHRGGMTMREIERSPRSCPARGALQGRMGSFTRPFVASYSGVEMFVVPPVRMQ